MSYMSDCDTIQPILLNMNNPASMFIEQDIDMILEEDALSYLDCNETLASYHTEAALHEKLAIKYHD